MNPYTRFVPHRYHRVYLQLTGIKPATFLLWSNSNNHCSTVWPTINSMSPFLIFLFCFTFLFAKWDTAGMHFVTNWIHLIHNNDIKFNLTELNLVTLCFDVQTISLDQVCPKSSLRGQKLPTVKFDMAWGLSRAPADAGTDPTITA